MFLVWLIIWLCENQPDVDFSGPTAVWGWTLVASIVLV